ncbi:MAG TPA: hypothetical protein DEH78_09420, partial [Solibacterales bacterium]|nr:hypothetical protein [Bryobacterales bacterium]
MAGAQERFSPFERLGRAYRFVNSIAFSPDGREMYFALLHREVLKARGEEVPESAPEVCLYRSVFDGRRWQDPELAPFSGTAHEYEPALSPDGRLLVFQSNREGKTNRLWAVRRKNGRAGWSAAFELSGINGAAGASYSTIARDGSIFFIKDDGAAPGRPNYNIL